MMFLEISSNSLSLESCQGPKIHSFHLSSYLPFFTSSAIKYPIYPLYPPNFYLRTHTFVGIDLDSHRYNDCLILLSHGLHG